MAEFKTWKRAAWKWRFWIGMAMLASPLVLHLMFPTLLPDWMVHAMAFVLDEY